MRGIIYKITNRANGKRYIGLTSKTLSQRWAQHCYDARQLSNQRPLMKAIRKYGKENFSIEEIDSADSLEELKEKERYWIKTLGTFQKEYNATEGGDAQTRPGVGYTKINIITGDIEAVYNSAKDCRNANGSNCTQNADKITNTQYIDYVIVKNQSIENMDEIEVRHYAFSLRPKIICQLDADNNIVNRWLNSTDILTNIPQATKSCIFDCLHNRRQTHLGYKWKYYQDIKEE